MDKKKNPATRNNFDRLASDLTKKERKDFLNRINPSDIEIRIPSESEKKESKESEKERLANERKGLVQNFKREPLYRKIVVWMKSFFLNSSVEEVYNTAVINSIAKRIEVLYPGLLNYKHRVLGNSMFTDLMDLKNAQDFFKGQLNVGESDSGVFYYILVHSLMPEFTEEVKKLCDPFQYTLEKPLGQDARNNLLNRLDEKLSSMPADMKDKVGQFSQSYEWLKMFMKIPIGAVVNKFSVSGEGRTCMFSQIKAEYSDLAKIISAKTNFSDELLKSVFLASAPISNFWKCEIPEQSKEDTDKLLESAKSEFSFISMFARKIPLRDLGKVINENSLYAFETFSAGDNWFQKYREQWRIVFDQRWRLWNREYKKEQVKKKLKIFFGLSDFQKFPYHPWRKYADEFPFKFDLSLGFVNYYFKQEYQKYASILNVVTLEGDFQIKENRHEFTDLVADYNEIMDKVDVLVGQVALGGEYGAEFMRYETSIKSSSAREKMSVLINEIEETAQYITDVFVNSGHKFEVLTRAMLGEHSTVYYGPLTNLNKIMGRDNREFRESLEKYAHSLKYACEIMESLREVDSFRV